jgi:ABC-type spermidine/putrescine transport system permease subunit I
MGCTPFDTFVDVAFWFMLGVVVAAALITFDRRRDDQD